MKKLMFAAPVVAVACAVSGCRTTLKDAKGNVVLDASGNTVSVANSRADEVKVAGEDAVRELKKRLLGFTTAKQCAGVESLIAEKLGELAIKGYTGDELKALEAYIRSSVIAYMDEVVFPRIVEGMNKRMDGAIEKLVADGEYEKAREVLWRVSTSGVAKIDDPVREHAMEVMRKKVNPANWEVIEKEINAKFEEFKSSKKYADGVKWLNSYPRVRTYSKLLDEQLKLVADELVKIGVADKDLDPILLATGDLVATAANILDVTDETSKTESKVESESAVDPELEEYEKKLAEYEETLVRYNCTPENAKAIAKNFDSSIRPLLKTLRKEAEFETISSSELSLGVAGLNNRIAAKCKASANELTQILYGAEISRIEAKVRELVAAAKYDEARDLIWKETSSADEDRNLAMRKELNGLINSLINPANWADIEKAFDENLAKGVKGADFHALLAFVRDFKPIRTYNETIDERLDSVRDELKRLGVDGKRLDNAVDATRRAAALAADLADNVDQLVEPSGDKAAADVPQVNRDQYEKLLKEYWLELVRNGCLKANADKLVADFRKMVEDGLSVKVGVGDKKVLLLGCNALNARIHARQVVDFEKLSVLMYKDEVRLLVEKGEFDAAREYVWKIPAEKDPAVEARMFAVKRTLIAEVINPANWKHIEAEFTAKVEECLKTAEFAQTLKWMHDYPYVRTYSLAFDECIDRMVGELVEVDAPEAKLDPVRDAARVFLDKLFADGEIDKVTQKVALDKYEAAVKEYKTALANYGCSEEQIASIMANWSNGVQPIIDDLVVTIEKRLGTSVLNERIDELRKAYEAKLIAAWTDDAANKLTMNVRALARAKKYDDARKMIRDVELIGDINHDRAIYAVRIGLLNAIVNPAQLDAMKLEMAKKLDGFYKAHDYKGAKDYLMNYQYVRDDYDKIAKSLEDIRAVLDKMEVFDDASQAAIDESARIIQLTLDARDGLYVSKVPSAADLDESLARLNDAIYAQLVDGNAALTKQVREILVKMLSDYRNVTTAQLNAELNAAVLEALAKTLDEEAKYLADAAAKAFSLDSQIAMAEDAISKQLGIVCPEASMSVNVLLGDYARLMRMLKMKQQISADDANTLLVGAVYLNQLDAFKYALKLGAKADGTSARDPLGRTPMMMAIQTGHLEFIDSILKAGGTFAGTDVSGNTTMHYAAKLGNRQAIIKSLAGAKPTDVNKAGETPLFVAVRKNQGAIAEIVIAQVAKDDRESFVGIKNSAGQTAFDVACDCGSRDALDALAAAGAEYGVGHLVSAAANNQVTIAEWLVNHGVDVNGEGVMAAGFEKAMVLAREGKSWETYGYLVRQGGVGECVLKTLAAEVAAQDKADAVKKAAEDAEAAGVEKGKAEAEEEAKRTQVKVILPKQDSVVIDGNVAVEK